ncbi:phage tail assembly protein [Ralstonia pickettii]|uniref:phage tail assembly protein n=1 Tax=Ralstonia pickettii TaxID=329 RepID=UPI0015B7F714|nr:phage tail assembly protein [Ralstonia pickettii]NWK44886.1 phage tail assembly protein [Ralstonia pickettii]
MEQVTTNITLDTPIKRGDQVISVLTLRKPGSGELRGVSLMDLMRMDVTALHTVLPRITAPTLTTADVSKLDLADLVKIATEVTGFLLSKQDREEAFLTESKTPPQTLQ